ncbi:hypothetical protein [Paenarthrobacter sp. A20]|uniref:hypothetical protein n=1 Tax=Paenarthrobacter sp. A20 TaxID=2817891 RepID=UPI0020A03B98|nr:hypothetical protein [Paenarthrobacter sp. A20]MCP1414375.1 hypothetical protein [Paenarthrobacter sp. A20]
MENDLIVWFLVWHALVEGFAEARTTDEILWMNGATWAQLWSGVIGAVAGAGVAMHVLRRTLREQTRIAGENERVQRELAATASAAQAELAAKQLTEQRLALERQLKEQRDALNLQLQEQRLEAALNREHTAISELMAFFAAEMEGAFSFSLPEHKSFGRLMGAVARWQLESKDKALIEELTAWLETWGNLVRVVQDPDNFNLSRNDAMGMYVRITGSMMSFARDWPHADPKDKKGIMKRVASARAEVPDPNLDLDDVPVK